MKARDVICSYVANVFKTMYYNIQTLRPWDFSSAFLTHSSARVFAKSLDHQRPPITTAPAPSKTHANHLTLLGKTSEKAFNQIWILILPFLGGRCPPNTADRSIVRERPHTSLESHADRTRDGPTHGTAHRFNYPYHELTIQSVPFIHSLRAPHWCWPSCGTSTGDGWREI